MSTLASVPDAADTHQNSAAQDILSAQDLRARQQAVILAFGRRTAAPSKIDLLMQDAVSLVAETLRVDYSSVVTTGNSQQGLTMTILPVADDAETNGTGSFDFNENPKTSLAAHTVRHSTPVVIHDLQEVTDFEDSVLNGLNITSVICVPLKLHDQVFGALGIYCKERREFTSEDSLFTETIAHLLTASIARMKADQELETQKSLFDTLTSSIKACIVEIDASGLIKKVNHHCEQLTGYSQQEIAKQLIWEALVPTTQKDMLHISLDRMLSGSPATNLECSLRCKDGTTRSLQWEVVHLRNDQNQIRGLLLSGIDITEQRRAEQEASAHAATAHKAKLALNDILTQLRNSGADGDSTNRHKQPFKAIQTQNMPLGQEGRQSIRREFHFRQRIAPQVGDTVPAQKDFFEASFRDISASGAAFLLSEKPTFTKVVIQLGKGEKVSFLIAEVARVQETTESGTPMYLVGCKFIGRMQSPPK